MEAGGGQAEYTFPLPLDQCGTSLDRARSGSLTQAENVIIVQLDPLVQEVSRYLHQYELRLKNHEKAENERLCVSGSHFRFSVLCAQAWDSARRISCSWEDSYQKSIRYN